MTNLEALEEAVSALVVGPEHRAMVQACRDLAGHIDARNSLGCSECGGPLGFDDKAWREYRLALVNLWEATSDGGTDSVGDLLAELRGGTKVSDAEDA